MGTMIALILFIIFGVGFAYFATQNAALITIQLTNSLKYLLPQYVVVITSFGSGLIIGGLFGVFKLFFKARKLSQQQHAHIKTKQEVVSLTKTIHQQELEIEKLKTRLGEADDNDDSL